MMCPKEDVTIVSSLKKVLILRAFAGDSTIITVFIFITLLYLIIIKFKSNTILFSIEMYRSQEIIKVFNEYNLPEEISKYILYLERQLLFENSIYEWLHFSHLTKLEKCKRFFYEDFNDIFLQEIKDIGGNFITLHRYKLRLWDIKRKNRVYGNYLNSLRY